MALLRRHKKTPPPVDETPPEPAPEARLTAYDAYGRAVSLTREEYRTRVLPATLRKSWDNPPGLYSAIVQGLLEDRAARGQRIAALHERDIASDPAWERRFFATIPVIELGGRRLELATSPLKLRRFLDDVLDGSLV